MIQTKGLHNSQPVTEAQPNEPASLVNGANIDEKKHNKVPKDAYEKQVSDIKARNSYSI